MSQHQTVLQLLAVSTCTFLASCRFGESDVTTPTPVSTRTVQAETPKTRTDGSYPWVKVKPNDDAPSISPTPGAPDYSRARHLLVTDIPLDMFLRMLAHRLKRSLSIEPGAEQIAHDARVWVMGAEVHYTDVLRCVLDPLGLSYDVTDTELRIARSPEKR